MYLECKVECQRKEEQRNKYLTLKKKIESFLKNGVENELLDKYYEDVQRYVYLIFSTNLFPTCRKFHYANVEYLEKKKKKRKTCVDIKKR